MVFSLKFHLPYILNSVVHFLSFRCLAEILDAFAEILISMETVFVTYYMAYFRLSFHIFFLIFFFLGLLSLYLFSLLLLLYLSTFLFPPNCMLLYSLFLVASE